MTAAVGTYYERVAERRVSVANYTRFGRTAPEIADLLGVSERTVIRIRRELGIAKAVPPPLTDEEWQRAAELLDDGCPYSEVARTLGRGASTIAQRLPGRGWSVTNGDCGRFAAAKRWSRERARKSGVTL